MPEILKNPGEDMEYPPVQFIADLSEYEKYFAPESRDEYLFLINRNNPVEEDYIPSDLVDVVDTRQDGRAIQKLKLYPAKALEAFLIEARANGINNITVTSAYRTYAQQEYLFNTRVANQMAILKDKEAAEAEVNKLTAYPGQSEHQSGVCLDMHTLGSALDVFGETPAAIWLAENAHNFGFILRYPADKVHITNVAYEPWHFRYVGGFHASLMHDLKMCLEEYIEYINNKKPN
jgi:LAS superfamily LD-carboxypeptidase LdcB